MDANRRGVKNAFRPPNKNQPPAPIFVHKFYTSNDPVLSRVDFWGPPRTQREIAPAHIPSLPQTTTTTNNEFIMCLK